MNTKKNLHTFHAFTVSLDAIRSLRGLLPPIQQHDGALANQLRRAAASIPLNIAEGRRRAGKDRLHLWRIAAGSAEESCACLYVAEAWGYISAGDAGEALEYLDRILAMLSRLTR